MKKQKFINFFQNNVESDINQQSYNISEPTQVAISDQIRYQMDKNNCDEKITLIENAEETAFNNQTPYMRATKAVSFL